MNKFICIIYFSSTYNILWYLSFSVWFHLEYSLSLSILLQKALLHCVLCCGGGSPLQCSCLENYMDRGVWQAAGNGVLKSWTQLSYFHFTIFPCIYVPHILYPFVCQWTFRCRVLAGINSAAKNIGVHVSFWISFHPFWILPRIGIAASCDSSIFSSLWNLHAILQSGSTIYVPSNSVGGFSFLHTLSSIYCL